MLQQALDYLALGVCVIPVKPREKAPALPHWEEYQTRTSTKEEIIAWWRTNPEYNIGLVHGPNGYAAFDIDHDNGVFEVMCDKFPALFGGRVERSGSGHGYHVPFFVSSFPDFGWDNSKNRPKGNKTWHTPVGDVNIRCQWCQTVAPPSIHPSGNPYTVIQTGDFCRADSLDDIVVYLSALDPKGAVRTPRAPAQRDSSFRPSETLESLKGFFPILGALDLLGVVGDRREENTNGDIRILKHGGLLVNGDKGVWYSYHDEIGGDVIDLWGWVRFGPAWNRYDKLMFAKVIKEMRDAAGIGTTRYQRPTINKPGHMVKASAYWG